MKGRAGRSPGSRRGRGTTPAPFVASRKMSALGNGFACPFRSFFRNPRDRRADGVQCPGGPSSVVDDRLSGGVPSLFSPFLKPGLPGGAGPRPTPSCGALPRQAQPPSCGRRVRAAGPELTDGSVVRASSLSEGGVCRAQVCVVVLTSQAKDSIKMALARFQKAAQALLFPRCVLRRNICRT